MKSFEVGCWFSTLSCFLASPLGVTRVLFSCVDFVPLLVWVEYYKNKWLVWLHSGVRNLIEWRLCLSLNQVYISFSFIIYVNLMLDISLRLSVGLVGHVEEVFFSLVTAELLGISGLMTMLSVRRIGIWQEMGGVMLRF